jgi:peptidoglycan/xylan/chitin deacetylase (PgdA/CDA1 family)
MRLPILMYHKVDRMPPGARYLRNYVAPEQFEAQLAALVRWGYRTVSFGDWLAYCGGRGGGRGSLPRRPIILTFDDGYRSTYEVAWPLLRRFGCTATVFLVSDLIGKTNAWDVHEIQEPLLGPAEIAAMQAGGIGFESHTKTHAPLTMIEPDRAMEELTASRATLAALLDTPVRILCYPYGKNNPAVRAMVRQAGYEAAVMAGSRMNTRRTDAFRLKRIGIDYRMTIAQLRWKLFRLRWLSYA